MSRLLLPSTCATVACLAVAAVPASASPSQGGFDVRVVPSHRSASAPSYFTLRLRPGADGRGEVEVGNTTSRAKRFYVSAVDGRTATTSGAVYANRQDAVRRGGRWVTPDRTQVTVPAHAHRRVSFAVRVPTGVAAGQYLAGLAIEDAAPTIGGNASVQIRQVRRDVVGVLVAVPGPSRFVPAVSSVGIKALPGFRVASVPVGLGNTGRRLDKPSLTVAMTGPSGYARRTRKQLDTVLGQDRIVYPDAWPDALRAGTYRVTATLASGGLSATRSATIRLTEDLDGTSGRPAPAFAARDRHDGGGTPWALLAGVLGAGLLGGLVLSRRRPT